MDITLALQRAVRGYKLGTQALAAAVSELLPAPISATTINHKVSPTYETMFCSPQEAVAIMEVTGDHGALMAMNAALRYVAIRLPDEGLGEVDDGCLQAQLCTVREFSDLMSAFTQAVQPEPGPAGRRTVRITDHERARIEKEAAEVIAAVQAIVGVAAAMNEAGKPAALRAVG